MKVLKIGILLEFKNLKVRKLKIKHVSFFFYFQVILGLLIPFYIRHLDFKSKEELQQMPQTEEEHLENQNLDNDDSDRSQPDAEVCTKV